MNLIDEARKLVVVREILDSTRFTGVWRGQAYECRALPGTTSMVAGDVAFCHVLPGSTELVAVFPPSAEELWFSPGSSGGSPNYVAELWKLVAGSSTPVHVVDCPNLTEFITHLAWSQIDSQLYCFTWYDDGIGGSMQVYRVNRSAGTLTLVATRAGAGPPYVDPVVDSAEFGANLYLLQNAYNNVQAEIVRFDPVAGTLTQVYDYGAAATGYGGGIAVDPTGSVIVASDGEDAVRSPSGDAGSWVSDGSVIGPYDGGIVSRDNFALLTNKSDDDLVYGVQNNPRIPPNEPFVIKRTAASTWAAELSNVPSQNGAVALSQEHTGATAVALWVQRRGASGTPEVWRRPVGGAWALDWAGPNAVNWFGVWSQGLAQLATKMYALFFVFATKKTRLYRRDSAGNWTLVQEWDGYELMNAASYLSGMAVAPNASRKCHEV